MNNFRNLYIICKAITENNVYVTSCFRKYGNHIFQFPRDFFTDFSKTTHYTAFAHANKHIKSSKIRFNLTSGIKISCYVWKRLRVRGWKKYLPHKLYLPKGLHKNVNLFGEKTVGWALGSGIEPLTQRLRVSIEIDKVLVCRKFIWFKCGT